MRLCVQIPCLNEHMSPDVLATMPTHIDGIDDIIVVVIDDGSDDKTVEVAKAHGVSHFVSHPRRRGLAQSFQDGVLYCLSLGADIIVNTDGDNQYPSEDIASYSAHPEWKGRYGHCRPSGSKDYRLFTRQKTLPEAWHMDTEQSRSYRYP